MRAMVTILSALLITLTAAADAGVSSCIENLHKKKVTMEFKGNKNNLFNFTYHASLEFDASKHGGKIVFSTDWGVDSSVEIIPAEKRLIQELPIPVNDQFLEPQTVISADCQDTRYKLACQATITAYFRTISDTQSRIEKDKRDPLLDEAISCVLNSLNQMKKEI